MTRIIGAALLGIVMANHSVIAQGASPATEVMVSGEVQAPGRAVAKQSLTLRTAIAQVGGFTADAAVVEIRRRASGAGPVVAATPPSEYRVQYVVRADLGSRPGTDPQLTGGEFIVVRRVLELHPPVPNGQFGAGAYRLDWAPWGVLAPDVLTSTEPQYTLAGMRLKLQGTVELEVVVNADGTVGGARVLRGLDWRLPDLVAELKRINDNHANSVLEVIGNKPLGLDANAVECVKTWTFTPGTILGDPKPIIHTVSVNFKLR